MAAKELLLVVAVFYVVSNVNALSCVKCDDKPCEVSAISFFKYTPNPASFSFTFVLYSFQYQLEFPF